MTNTEHKRSTFFAVTIFFISLLYFGVSANAQSKPKQVLLALSKKNHTLAIVNPSTLNVIAKIPVGEDPHEVVASSDGKTAYVSIYGGGSLHEINVIDLVGQKPSFNIDTKPFFGPHGLTFVNNELWFTAEGSKAVARFNPDSSKIDWCMGTGQDRTHMIYVTADAKRIYTTNVSSGTVSILVDTIMSFGNFPPLKNNGSKGNAQPQGNMPPPPPGPQNHETWIQTIVPTARGSEGFGVTPDGKELWTASSEDGNISIIDLSAKKLATKIDAKVSGANRLQFTPDGKLAFISSLQTGEVTIYDVKTRKEIKRLKIGNGDAGILMDPSGTRVFVACTADNYVAVIDLKTLEVTNKIDVGGNPDGLAWASEQ